MMIINKKIAVGIIICTLILTTSASVLMGIMNTTENFLGGDNVFLITQKGDPNPIKSSLYINLAYAIENLSISKAVSPEIFAFSTLKGEPVIVRGAIPDRLLAVDDAKIIDGKTFDNNFSAMVGDKLAERLSLHVGDHIALTGSFTPSIAEFLITGIYDTQSSTNDEIIVSLQAGRQLGDIADGRVSLIRVKTSDSEAMSELLSPTMPRFIISNITFSPQRVAPGDTVSVSADVYNWGTQDGYATLFLQTPEGIKIDQNKSFVPEDEIVKVNFEYTANNSGSNHLFVNLTGSFPMLLDTYIYVMNKPLYINGPLEPEVYSTNPYYVVTLKSQYNTKKHTNETVQIPVSGASVSIDNNNFITGSSGMVNYTFKKEGSYVITAYKSEFENGSIMVKVMNRTTPLPILVYPPKDKAIIRAGMHIVFEVTSHNLWYVDYKINNNPNWNRFDPPYDINTTGWSNGVDTITIFAIDHSNQSTTLSFNIIVDNIPPTISVVSIQNNSAIKLGTPINIQVNDNNGLANLFYSLGSNITNISLDNPVISTSGWPQGVYTIIITATDTAGNIGQFLLTVTLENTPPQITLISPYNNSIISPGVFLRFNITGFSNISEALYSIDNYSFIKWASPYVLNTSLWSSGNHFVLIRASDIAKVNASNWFIFTIDDSYPIIGMYNPENQSVIHSGASVTIKITDPNGNGIVYANYTINGLDLVNITLPPQYICINTTNWSEGSKLLVVNVVNLVGHCAQNSFNITIDDSRPTIELNKAAGSPYNNTYFSSAYSGKKIHLYINDSNIGLAYYSINKGPKLKIAYPYTIDPDSAWQEPWEDGRYFVNITAIDKAGNQGFLSLNYTIYNERPLISVISPPSGYYIPNGTLIKLNITDPTGIVEVMYWYGTKNFYLNPKPPYYINTTGWALAQYLIGVRAKNGVSIFGYLNYYSFTIDNTIDSTPPYLSLKTPTNGSSIQSGVPIAFNIFDRNATMNGTLVTKVYYSLNNGSQISLSAPYTIDTYAWPNGTYNVTISAFDESNNSAVKRYVFVINNSADNISPRINLTPDTPQNNSIIKNGTVLKLLIFDNLKLRYANYTLDGKNWTRLKIVNNITSIPTLNWTEGQHDVTITAYDIYGNNLTAVFIFYIDCNPPVIQIASPLNYEIISSSTLIKIGIMDNYILKKSEYSIDNGTKILIPSNNFVTLTGLFEGNHSITVWALPQIGNYTKKEFNFNVDDTPPTIDLISPKDNSNFYFSTVVSLNISDIHLYKVTYSINSGGTQILPPPYVVGIIASTSGTYKFTITATDYAGNKAIKNYYFNAESWIDSGRPQINLVSPANKSMIHSGQDINFEIKDTCPIYTALYTINNGSANDFPLSYSIDTTGWIDSQCYFISLFASDDVGNSNESSYVFILDDTPPVITLLSPANDSMIKAGVAIKFDINDINGISEVWYIKNGATLYQMPPPYDISTSSWNPGAYKIDIFAKDTNQNVATDEFIFTVLQSSAKVLDIQNLLPSVVSGYNATLRIIDLETGEPVTNAKVTINTTVLNSDSSGFVTYTFSQVGIFQVIVEKAGYQPCYRSIQVFPNFIINVFSLSVVPVETTVGQMVDVIVTIDNSGENTGIASYVLYANDVPVGNINNVTIPGMQSKIVTLSYSPDQTGKILLKVGGCTTVLTVKSKLDVNPLVGIIISLGPRSEMTTARGPLMYEMIDISKGNIMLVLVALILFASMLVTFGISSLLSKSVLERKSVLGILKSIGASRSQIRFILIKETLFVSIPSALIGVFGGIGIAIFMEQSQLLIIFGQILYPMTDPIFIFLMVGLIIVLSIVSAVLIGLNIGRKTSVISIVLGGEKRTILIKDRPLEEILKED